MPFIMYFFWVQYKIWKKHPFIRNNSWLTWIIQCKSRETSDLVRFYITPFEECKASMCGMLMMVWRFSPCSSN